MNPFRFHPTGLTELRTIMQIHQNFISGENPEGVYVLYGLRRTSTTDVTRSVQVHNSHPEPTEGFQVRRSDLDLASVHLLEAEPFLEPVGVVHTHEGPEAPGASVQDVQSAVDGYLHIVLCPRYRTIVVYDAHAVIARFTMTDEGAFIDPEGVSLSGLPLYPQPHERDQR